MAVKVLNIWIEIALDRAFSTVSLKQLSSNYRIWVAI